MPESRAASISLKQLKLFESVGRLKNVRRASEECNLSQPAVTQALGKLEQQAGHILLDRRASGSYLNELGHILHRRTLRFFQQIEQAIVVLGAAEDPAAAPFIVKRLSRSQLRSLVAIVEGASLREAADTLGLSQPSLQRAAHDLERNLGKPLYCRTSSGIMVTPDGAEFGRRVKLATQEIEWGLREIETALGSTNAKIVIGAMPCGGTVLLASVLDELVASNPGADVSIINENASELLKSLRVGNVDLVLGLLQEQQPDILVNEPLASTPYLIVAKRGHRLLRKGVVTIDDLLAYEWVVGTPDSSRRAQFEQLFAGGRTPQTPVATCSLAIIRHLLARNDRLTLMTSYELTSEGDAFAAVPFAPITPIPEIGITTRASWQPTQLHADFIKLLRRRVTDVPMLYFLKKVG